MISIRPCRKCRARWIFIARLPPVVGSVPTRRRPPGRVVCDRPAASPPLHRVERLRLHPREQIEREQREHRDQQTERGRNQRLRDARRHLRRRDQRRGADHVERLHHARDGAEQAEQRRRSHYSLEHPQSARQRLFDPACLIAGARFDPPRGLVAIVGDHLKEASVCVARPEFVQPLLEFDPRKSEGLDQVGEFRGQPQASRIEHGPVDDYRDCEHAQRQQRIDHRAAELDGVPRCQ